MMVQDGRHTRPVIATRMMRLFGVFVVLVLANCSTYSSVRPLAPGQHAVSATLGGAIASVPNLAPIPVPNITVEGRHGLIPHLELQYGVNALPALFGVANLHAGLNYQFNDDSGGALPVFTVSEKLFGFSNLVNPGQANKSFYALSQTDLFASWEFYDQRVYVGAAAYVPLTTLAFGAAPVVGVDVSPGLSWLRLQLEGRWLSPWANTDYAVVEWLSPGGRGGIAVQGSVAFVFGGAS
jgi:hypothetical protein